MGYGPFHYSISIILICEIALRVNAIFDVSSNVIISVYNPVLHYEYLNAFSV